jgi:DNA-binding HxlR family transcriptional regulator
MKQKKLPELLDCGLSIAIKVIGGKWKAWIMDCLRRGVNRPSTLQREIGEINQRVINLHLRELEMLGIIEKKVFAEVPVRVEYHLTPLGKSILPAMEVLEKWGNENREQVLRRYNVNHHLLALAD